jgi:ADP-L-glycero-D-manno-heptose 6-epimerase
MIAITGAAGFIGSALLAEMNQHYPDLPVVIVDNFARSDKRRNYQHKKWLSCVERQTFFRFLEENHHKISFVFHLGARTDTTETDVNIFDRLNLNYSKKIWTACSQYAIPLIYASSAATYGDGQLGYADDHKLLAGLQPLNAYGESKNDFDRWVLQQEKQPPFWAGLKFFNVYGPNEYHKGRMASVIFHAFNQIRIDKKMHLFRSHREDYKDGQQVRDFIYVKDVIRVLRYIYENKNTLQSAIYNLGTGEARSFEDLTLAVFKAMGIRPNIEYIDMPEDIRENYQYFTQAEMAKLREQGFIDPFISLEEGIDDYVKNFLFEKTYL